MHNGVAEHCVRNLRSRRLLSLAIRMLSAVMCLQAVLQWPEKAQPLRYCGNPFSST